MVSAIKIGLSGLTAASTQLEVSANNISHLPVSSSKAFQDDLDTISSQKAYQPKKVQNTPLKSGGVKAEIYDYSQNYEVSLAEEIVNLKIAEHTYKANALVIKTALENENTLLKGLSDNKN